MGKSILALLNQKTSQGVTDTRIFCFPYRALLSAIFSAKQRIWIVTPYFVPDKSLMQALVIAHHRGVDIKLITPATSNHLIADLARSSYMRDLCNIGIDVCLLPTGMIHAINFRSLSWYQFEFSRLYDLINQRKGPMNMSWQYVSPASFLRTSLFLKKIKHASEHR